MFKFMRLASLLAVVALSALAGPGHPMALAANAPEINFKLLYRAAQLANQAYDGKSEILGKYPGDAAWVATPGHDDVQYILLQNDKRKVQAIAVRGTANDTNWHVDMDTRAVEDQKAGILMHQGFRDAALAIYQSVKPRLKPGYTTYLTGHSLGGAVAAILGIYFTDDKIKVAGIYTFGQPKFTDVAGAEAYSKLPILRVIYQNDTVTLVPDSPAQGGQEYAHIGSAINLLSGPYYVYGTSQQALQFSQGSFAKLFGQISVTDHHINWYLENLRGKLNGVIEVSFQDRDKYIVRHHEGRGTSEPTKYKNNFNTQE